mmetsp:Transcript_23499/g.75816  ORF Transcript_23499/g.75816 Transcript_23499/m.75816 type:complete len:246 (-) Transcript_23499:1014-1751(-)
MEGREQHRAGDEQHDREQQQRVDAKQPAAVLLMPAEAQRRQPLAPLHLGAQLRRELRQREVTERDLFRVHLLDDGGALRRGEPVEDARRLQLHRQLRDVLRRRHRRLLERGRNLKPVRRREKGDADVHRVLALGRAHQQLGGRAREPLREQARARAHQRDEPLGRGGEEHRLARLDAQQQLVQRRHPDGVKVHRREHVLDGSGGGGGGARRRAALDRHPPWLARLEARHDERLRVDGEAEPVRRV